MPAGLKKHGPRDRTIPHHMAPELESELPHSLPCAAAEEAAQAPGCAAVLLLLSAAGEPVQLVTTQNLRRFLVARFSAPVETSPLRADLSEVVRGVRWHDVACPFEARWRHWRLARRLYPRDYRKRIGFGPAYFLQFDPGPPVAELRITEHPTGAAERLLGPWHTARAATQALEGLWDLFELCRHPEQVRRAPHGKRCPYADMGRCDAPCDGAAPLPVYEQRVAAAWQFACSGGQEWLASAEQRMRAAAAAQEFERAGLMKLQVEFVTRWIRDWSPHLRRFDRWHEAWLLPATRRKAWKLFIFRRGALLEGPLLPERKLAAEAPAWIAAQRDAEPPAAPTTEELTQQSWLAAHHLGHRESEATLIFPLADGQPMRAQEIAARLEARNRETPSG